MFRGVECREALDLEPTPPNQRYAIRLRGEILNEIGRGTFNYAKYFPESAAARRFGFAPADKTVGALLDEHELLTRPAVEPSTWYGYAKVIEGHLRPWFGTTRARDLTAAMIRTKLLEGSRSLKTARNILSVLNVPLERAVADGELDANPCERVKLAVTWPRDRRDTDFEADPFSMDEMLAIFGAAGEEEGDYWRAAFGAGLRTSEQIELRWPRVDLAAFRLTVSVARVRSIDGTTVKGPKTVAGKREIGLTAGAYEALARQHARTGEGGGHVWRDVRWGAPWANEGAVRRTWTALLKRAGVRYRNPYQTRHTFASVLLAAGMPPLRVAKWMGHEGTEMLSRHYGRWIEQGASIESRAALDRFFSPASPTEAKIRAFSL